MTGIPFACKGMLRSALWLLSQVGPTLNHLYTEGYDVVLTGHSLGGGVAAIITYLLRNKYAGRLRSVVYGCPSCVDSLTADALKQQVINVIVHDDFITRVTPLSIRRLMKELMEFREEIFKHMHQDWADVISRAGSLWSPRWRERHGPVPDDISVPTVEKPTSNFYRSQKASSSSASMVADSSDVEDNDDVVIVEEETLPELWQAGRILHLYSYRGQYRRSRVTRDFETLRKIEIQGHIFSNHLGDNIYEALLEARAVQRVTEKGSEPPRWTAFDEVSVCQCCGNAFTWHTTFRGEAQEYREKYNCRFCGHLVCGPCSDKEVSIPRYGLKKSRICDTCYHQGDFSTTEPN